LPQNETFKRHTAGLESTGRGGSSFSCRMWSYGWNILKGSLLSGEFIGVVIVVYSSQDTLLVSSTLSNPIGLSFTQSSTSAKIPKRFKSDFQNRGAPLDLPFCWRCECGTQNKKRTPDQTGKVWQPVALLEGFVCRFLSLSVGICLGDNLFSSRNFWT